MNNINQHFFYEFVEQKLKRYNNYKAHFNAEDGLYFFEYINDEKNVFIPFYIDINFIESNGTEFLVNMSLKSKSCMAKKMIELYETDKIISVISDNKNISFKKKNLKAIDPEDFLDVQINHLDKIDDLLKILYNSNQNLNMFDNFNLTPIMAYKCNIATRNELNKILGYLHSSKLISYLQDINSPTSENGYSGLTILPTIEGYSYLNKKKQLDSNSVFIAMQFSWDDNILNNELRSKFKEAVLEACNSCGYIADTVSTNHTNNITDQIIREIRESRFVITDFTFNNRGAYYEAGFARALGKDVIHLIHKDHKNGNKDFEKLHFDISQINYIEWDDLENLKSSLKNRIKALGY